MKTPVATVSLESLLRNGFTDSIISNDQAQRLESLLIDHVRDFHDEVQRMRREVHPDIVNDRIKARAEVLLDEIESQCGGLLRGIGRAWATDQQRLQRLAGLGPSTDPSATVKEMWVLDRLRELDASKRLVLLQGAIERGDDLTIRSVLNAPRAFAVVDDQLAEQLRQEWHERYQPEAVAAYKATSEAYEVEQRNFASAIDAVRKIAGIEAGIRERLEGAQGQQAPE